MYISEKYWQSQLFTKPMYMVLIVSVIYTVGKEKVAEENNIFK